MKRYVLLTTLILCSCSCICLAGDVIVTHIANVGIKCHAVDFFTIGQHRYVVADSFLINVDNPEKPISKPGFMFSRVEHVKAVGKHAYIAANVGGLQILDVNNPDDIKIVGKYKPEGASRYTAALCVDVESKYAYVTFAGDGQSEHYGLYILDISDPAQPRKLGFYTSSGMFSDVVVSDDYAYLTVVKSGLQIIDIREPSNPKLVGSCKLPGMAGGVDLVRKYCLVTAHDKGLAIVDVNNPMRPRLVTTCDMAGGAKKVAVSDSFAFVAAQSGGTHIVDIESISNPKVLVSHPTKMLSLDVVASGNYAFIANLLGGLDIIKIEDAEKNEKMLPMPVDSTDKYIRGYLASICVGLLGGSVKQVTADVGFIRVGFAYTKGLAEGLEEMEKKSIDITVLNKLIREARIDLTGAVLLNFQNNEPKVFSDNTLEIKLDKNWWGEKESLIVIGSNKLPRVGFKGGTLNFQNGKLVMSEGLQAKIGNKTFRFTGGKWEREQ